MYIVFDVFHASVLLLLLLLLLLSALHWYPTHSPPSLQSLVTSWLSS
jgi:hypothetical protein